MNPILAKLVVRMATPWISRWVEKQESRILAEGRPLSPREVRAAFALGVRYPERLRVLSYNHIPMPGPPFLWRIAEQLGFPATNAVGMCLRYGIMLHSSAAQDFQVLLHECAHTMQYERAGSPREFIREYLRQCLIDGYHEAAWEKEARELQARTGFLP